MFNASHEPTRDCLWGHGYRDQRERSQDRQSQTFQTRQWPGSRRVLSMTALRCIHREDSAFGVYDQRLVQRGRKSGSALMAVFDSQIPAHPHIGIPLKKGNAENGGREHKETRADCTNAIS
jgi:hypothetical protein